MPFAGEDRARQLDARRLYRRAVQDHRQIHRLAGRAQIARALGHQGPSRCAVRPGGVVGRNRNQDLHVPLPLGRPLDRNLQDLLRPGPENLRGPRSAEARGANRRSQDPDRTVQHRARRNHGGSVHLSASRHREALNRIFGDPHDSDL